MREREAVGVLTVELGPEDTVFGPTQQCDATDVPDNSARPSRLADGSVVVAVGNAPRFRFLFGSSFGDLRRLCDTTVDSRRDPDPSSFRGLEWIMAVYRQSDTIHALVHNEHHDATAPNCLPGNDGPANPCWYNAVTYAFSTDGARTFAFPVEGRHLVAPPPTRWDARRVRPTAGASEIQGYLEPSNIVRANDGYFYVLIRSIPDVATQSMRGTCVMRTRTLGDPSSWRAWDGSEFALAFANPYVDGAGAPCAFVSRDSIGDLNGHLSYNTFLQRYMLVGASVRSASPGRPECGFYYSTSADLVHWSAARILRRVPLPHPRAGCRPNGGYLGTMAYPAVIDHGDSSVNFERPGRSPHLYFVRYGQTAMERALVRQPIRLTLTQQRLR